MPDITHQGYATTFDGASGRLREILEDLGGISEETLEAIDWISQPRSDCPPPQDAQRHAVFNRLVLLALAEAELHRQRQARTTEKAAKN